MQASGIIDAALDAWLATHWTTIVAVWLLGCLVVCGVYCIIQWRDR